MTKHYVEQSEVTETIHSSGFAKFLAPKNHWWVRLAKLFTHNYSKPEIKKEPTLQDVADYFNSHIVEFHGVDEFGVYWISE